MPYRVMLRGAEVVAETLDDLDALLERHFGARDGTARATAVDDRLGAPMPKDQTPSEAKPGDDVA
jgi:hypothetical protein